MERAGSPLIRLLAFSLGLIMIGLTPLSDKLRTAGRTLFSPATESLSQAGITLTRATDTIRTATELHTREAALLQRLREEEAKVAKYRYLEAENQSLRRELGLPLHTAFQTTPAQVSAGQEGGILVLDKGSKQGISEGLAATSAGSLVGVIKQVRTGSSELLLSIQPGFVLPVRIPSRSLSALARGNGQALRVEMITRKDRVEIGDEVTTTATSQIPGGILIGKVSRIRDRGSLFREVEVAATYRPLELQQIYIIIAPKP